MLENPQPAAASAATSPAAAHAPQVSMQVDAATVTNSGYAFTRFLDQVDDILSHKLPLSMIIAGLGQGRAATESLRHICSGLAHCAATFGIQERQIVIVIAANAMLPSQAWTIRRDELGAGPVYMLASEAELRVGLDDHRQFLRFWHQLWQRRADGYLRVACAATVRSCCDLLAHEAGATVLPGSAVQAPVGSAWIAQSVDLGQFADAGGLLDRRQLRTELQHLIESGLQAHEETIWPNACMRHDSWLNRRLALLVGGIGDLVVRRQQDPGALACLANLRATLCWLRTTVLQLSRDAALTHDAVPALSQFDPVQQASGDHERWRQRWSEAVAENAIASRNLLVMSPWSVFPVHSDPDPAFLNLLPLLDFADACAFPEPPQLNGWNIKDFMQLHQRMWAVLERRCTPHRFAEQV